MIRIAEIQDALLHLVGWEQNIKREKTIHYELTRSESGLMFQGAHPLLTLTNIESIMPDEWCEQYGEWSEAKQYSKGDVVKHNDILWEAKRANKGVEPAAEEFDNDYSLETYGSADWHPINALSDYIKRATRSGIATAVQKFLADKSLAKESKTLLENRTFFDGAGRIKDTLPNRHKLVGFEITPARALGVTTYINRVGLQLSGPSKVKMHLFHSSQVEPIKSWDLDYTKKGGFQWFSLGDCYLPYKGDSWVGGSWYLCYSQDELAEGVEAINVGRDFSKEPCGTCNRGNLQAWRELTKYLQIAPFVQHAPTTFADYPEMWDVETISYTSNQNHGMNVDVTVGCDLTDFIISQRAVFQNVIQKQVAYNLLRTMAMNPDVRVNRNQANVSMDNILYELDGNTQGRASGLGHELAQAYKALNIDTDGIDRVCLSCNNGGVKYRTV